MDATWKDLLWSHLGAAIDMLENALTDEKARKRAGFDWLDANLAELVLYSLRHVQHHAAQLNLILRQRTGSAPRWVAKAKGS